MKTKSPKALNDTNRIVSWTIMGLQFGYPPCCVGEFIIHNIRGTWRTRKDRQFYGTGYVPCVKCNELPAEQLLAYINSNRQVETSFPEEPIVKRIKAA